MASKIGLEVGDTVSVASADGKTQKRAVVSWLDEGTADVVYEKISYAPIISSASFVAEEESKVTFDRIVGQAPVEVDESKFNHDAEKHKAIGGVHFRNKNFVAAYNEYLKALGLLQSGPVRALAARSGSVEAKTKVINSIVGASVLVQVKRSGPSCKFTSATVATVGDKTADVMFEDGDAEEDGVAIERLVLVSSDKSIGQLQCNLYLNLARCCAKFKDNASAAWFATIAISLGNYFVALKKATKQSSGGVESKTDLSAMTISRETWLKAFYIRAKSHLTMRHFKQARTDGNKILKLDPDNRDAQKLLDSIKPLEERQFKKDKKLVKEVCKMVDEAMSKSPSKKK